MFRRLRLQLTLWYVGILALIVAVVVVLVYFLVAHSLDEEINDSLREVNQQTANILRSAAQPPPPGQASSGLPEPIARDGEAGEEDEEGDEHDEHDEHEQGESGGESSHSRDDEFVAVAAGQPLGATGDVFLLVLDASGDVVANPRDAPLDDLPYRGSLAGALEQGDAMKDVTVDDSHLRLLTVAVAKEGEAVGFVVTGKSLEHRDQELRLLLVLLAVGGGVGVVLAGLGGLWVAGLAMRPVRRSFERQKEFVADVSHELRTPVAVVRANAEMLLAKAPTEGRQPLADIVAESEHMGRLVEDMLTLTQDDQARLELRREPVDLYDVIESAARATRPLAQERGLDLSASSQHVTVYGDPHRLRELVLVLVDNAVKYTEPGGRITLTGALAGGRAEIVVQDTGIGIPPQHLPHIFDRFYRADKARSRAHGGTGLGLAIGQAIARAHGGTIEIHSTPGRGTQARVTVPLRTKTSQNATETT